MESAYTFFDDDMRKELTADNLSVDIACQFIKYRDRNGLTQQQLAKKLQIPKGKLIELESGDYDFTISELCNFARMLSWDITVIFSQSKPVETFNSQSVTTYCNK